MKSNPLYAFMVTSVYFFGFKREILDLIKKKLLSKNKSIHFIFYTRPSQNDPSKANKGQPIFQVPHT